MTYNPMVSIIIPVFNGSNYLREAIQSAINQTYSNIEIIVINDGSDDRGKTRKIALSFGKKINYYEKENGGVATALNMGIKKMRGEYFSWLSHDDRYKPDKIKSQMQIIESLQDKTTIIYGSYDLIDANGKTFHSGIPGKMWSREQLQKPLFPIFKGVVNGCTLLIHKSHFERVGIFDESLLATQDIDLWFRMLRGKEIYYQEEAQTETRIHDQRGSLKLNRRQELNSGWIRRMHSVTSKEMREVMGSAKDFYNEVSETLKGLEDYKEAYAEAQKLCLIYDKHTKNNNKVSVIIPFYNRLKFVEKSIMSVMRQSYRNLEIILIDDGSTEDISYLLRFISADSRIRYIHQKHSGVTVARNRGIVEATGDYIAFLDSDDLFHTSKIESQLKFMLDNEYVYSHTSYQRMTEEEKSIQNMDSAKMSGIVFPQILNICLVATSTVMVKRVALQNIRFMENIKISEDVCFWIDLAYQYELGGLNKYLSKIRIGKDTTFYNRDAVRWGYLNILNYIFSKEEYLNEKDAIYTFVKNFSTLFLSEEEVRKL